jgi:hypothetical protein
MNRNDQQFMAQKIRTQYVEKESTELDALRTLDTKVKRPANTFAYIFGSIGAIVMGCGMSLIMTDIAKIIGLGGNTIVLGTVIGIVGMLIAVINYPIYKAMLKSRKSKYAAEIITLSDKIINK